ncbi:MAG: ComEC/Rec2 family competence protein [bacterium]
MPPLSKIPSFWIVVFMMLGASIYVIMDITPDAFTLLIASCCFLLGCSLHAANKVMSSMLFGMFIMAEVGCLQPKIPHKHTVRMKGIVNGRVVEHHKASKVQTVIIKGYIDTPQLPRLEKCIILVTIHGNELVIQPGMFLYIQCHISNPRIKHLPDEFDEYRYALSGNIQWLARCKAKDISIIDKRRNSGASFIYAVQTWIREAIDKTFHYHTKGIAKGLLLGDISEIDKNTRKTFSMMGTAHILSVSGFHAGVIVILLHVMLAWIPSLPLRVAILMMALICFLFIVDWDPPATRACFMAGISVFTKALQRSIHPLHALFLCISFMIAIEPSLVHSIGFQMSAVGMFGLITLTNFFAKIHYSLFNQSQGWTRFIADSLSVSLSASFMLMPLTAWYFGMISLIAPLANLVCIPLFTLALCWIIASVICFTFSVTLAETFSIAAHQLLDIALNAHQTAMATDSIAYIGKDAFMISLCIVFCILLVYSSRNAKLFIANCIGVSIFLIGVHTFEDARRDEMKRQNFTYMERNEILILISHSKIQRLFLLDRDPYRRAIPDKSLIDHLLNDYDIQQRHYSGRASKSMATAIKRIHDSIEIHETESSCVKRCIARGKVYSTL